MTGRSGRAGPSSTPIRSNLGALGLCLVLGVGLGVGLTGDDGPTRPAATSPAWPAVPSPAAPTCDTGCPADAVAATGAPSGVPTRVRIPRIRVDAELSRLRLDRSGRLIPPTGFADAGWYVDGVVPGDPGPAVVAGHVDSKDGPAVFHRLPDLRPGDRVEVRRGDRWLRFRVTGASRHAKAQFPTTAVYGPTPGPELRLITCTGVFDRSVGHYRDNLVVFAVAELPVVIPDSAAG